MRATMLTLADMRRCWGFYLDGGDPRHPDVAPLCAGDLHGLPPAWVAVAGLDPLRDDGLRYADALRGAGVATHVRRFDDMVHGFLRWAGVVDRARELVDWLGDAARDAAAER
jgi:acetyl esterase